MTKTLIVGYGEIGKSLEKVLASKYEVDYTDKDKRAEGTFKVINVCFPYGDTFEENCFFYKELYNADLVLIHSTIPPGTTRNLGKGFVHSPVSGRHPNLEQGIRTFPKYIGALDEEDREKASQYLEGLGLDVCLFNSPEETETAKILCTSYYGLNIVYMKEVERLCKEAGLDFENVYTKWNNEYNNGYDKLKEPQFHRPVLKPMLGKIGGHCVIKNTYLLDSFITKLIKEKNDTY